MLQLILHHPASKRIAEKHTSEECRNAAMRAVASTKFALNSGVFPIFIVDNVATNAPLEQRSFSASIWSSHSMHRGTSPAIRLLLALLLAVFIAVPSVEAMVCGDQGDVHALQESSKLSDPRKDHVSTHGHCHHGGVCQVAVALTLEEVATASESLVLVAAGNLPSDRRDGLIRPPRG